MQNINQNQITLIHDFRMLAENEQNKNVLETFNT